MISYSEAKAKCVGQIRAFPSPIEGLPQKAPDPNQDGAIRCLAKVAFQPIEYTESEVVGKPSPWTGECIHSPNPHCQDCALYRLEKEIAGTRKRIKRPEVVDERIFDVFLAEAGLK